MYSETLETWNPYDNIKVLKTTKDSTLCHCGQLESGDTFAITKVDKNYNVGDYYHNEHFIITKVLYAPKSWWKFWKKKEIIGYYITVEGVNNNES